MDIRHNTTYGNRQSTDMLYIALALYLIAFELLGLLLVITAYYGYKYRYYSSLSKDEESDPYQSGRRVFNWRNQVGQTEQSDPALPQSAYASPLTHSASPVPNSERAYQEYMDWSGRYNTFRGRSSSQISQRS